MMPEPYCWFVGIDWATESHEVCVLDRERSIVDRKTIEHSGKGIAQLVEILLKLCGSEPGKIAVAIEMPRGAIVETLVERQFAVYSLNPKQMDRFRDRHTVAGAKDDSRDAYVMADALRTDLHLFHRVQLDDQLVIRLRELSRTEEDIEQAMVRAGHQLRELLIRYYPQMLKLCPGVDEPWFWDLIELAPLPAKAAKLTRSKVEGLLRSHRIRRITAEQIVAGLGVPALQLAPGAAEAASEHVLLALPLLRLLRKQRQDLAGRIQGVIEEMGPEGEAGEHRDVTIILSLPGVGRSVTATMLAEASQALAERDYHALRSYAGAAPITRQSGKRRIVSMRRSCNPRLRNALYHWARVSTQRDERSKKHYAELRAKGHSHGRALRGVADRLVAVLISMLKSKTLYDPHFALPEIP
jgi:transposase